MNFLSMQNSPVNWFDLLIVIVILLGVRTGRKNGMSVELVPMIQWMVIVAAGALLYKQLGDWMSDAATLSHLFCYIACYLIIAIVVKGIFTLIKKSAGGKLTGSDLFGRAEF